MLGYDAPPSPSLLHALRTVVRAFSAVLGVAGFGLLGGLGYGAWVASQGVQDDLAWLGWLICLILYGSIGFVVGLALGLVGLAFVGGVRLVKRSADGSGADNG